MKRHTHFISGLLTILLLSSSPSYAWDSRGHMMVAAIDYQRLSQSAKDRVDALLPLNPDRDNCLTHIPAFTSAAKEKMMFFMIAAQRVALLERG